MAQLLDVRDLSVDLLRDGQQRRVLDGVTFSIGEGEVLGLVGEAGAGKSVLARSLVRAIQRPLAISGGTVEFQGRELLTCTARELATVRGNRIGFIGANPMGSLDPRLPVGEQIVEKLRCVRPGLSRRVARDKVMGLLERVRIPSPATRFHEAPFQFSGGMMQRVMIVDALVSDPALVIADNITQPLDVTVAAQIIDLIAELRQTLGTAFLFISSSLPVVTQVAARALVMQDGRIVEEADVAQLVRHPAHDYSRSLIARLPPLWKGASAPVSPPATAPAILTVSDAVRTYRVRRKGTFNSHNEIKAVRGVSFDVRAGENLGIVGESGCGKSTLTRLLAWLEMPDSGTITFAGRDLGRLSGSEMVDTRKSFQLLLQDPYGSLPAGMPVLRMVEEPMLIHGASRAAARAAALDAMAEVGLPPDLANRLPVGLSAGQRQRINIARALVLKPRLLILDETLSALDQVEQAELLNLFSRLQEAHGFSYIFISHDLALVRKMCHRIAVMYLGRIVELADNDTLFNRPSHPYSRALLSAMPTLEEPRFLRADHLIEGEPPSPIDLPLGCAFRSRCPAALPACAGQDPALAPLPDGNLAACLAVQYAAVQPA